MVIIKNRSDKKLNLHDLMPRIVLYPNKTAEIDQKSPLVDYFIQKGMLVCYEKPKEEIKEKQNTFSSLNTAITSDGIIIVKPKNVLDIEKKATKNLQNSSSLPEKKTVTIEVSKKGRAELIEDYDLLKRKKRCSAKNSRGQDCRRYIIPGSKYCYTHLPPEEKGKYKKCGVNSQGKRCKRYAIPGSEYCPAHQPKKEQNTENNGNSVTKQNG